MSTIFQKEPEEKDCNNFSYIQKDFIYTEELPKDHYTSKKILLGVFIQTSRSSSRSWHQY